MLAAAVKAAPAGPRPGDVGGYSLRRRSAMMDFEDGRLPDAERELDALVALLHERKEPTARRELAAALSDRATVRRYSNRWQDALDDLAAAISIAAELPPLARSSLEFGARFTRAKLLCTEATPVHDVAAAEREVAAVRALAPEPWMVEELACEIARQRGDWAVVARLSPEIGARLGAQGWTAGSVFAAVRTAQARMELGHLDSADAVLQPALRFLELHGPPDQHARARLTAARIASARGHHDIAWDAALAGLALIDSLVRHFRSPADQHRFVADKLKHYLTAFDVGAAAGGHLGCVRAWTIAERSKSFYLCQLVANGDVALFDGVDPAEVQRLNDLEVALDERECVAAELSGEAARSAMQVIRGVRMERDEAYSRLMRANPRWAALRAPPPFAIEAVLQKLHGRRYDAYSLFLRPAAGGGADLHLFWATAAGVPTHRVERLTNDELGLLDACRAALDSEGAANVFLHAFPPELATRVWPEALLAELSPERPLLLSAHGVLAGLALHAARLPDGLRPIELCPVFIVPTLALLTLPARRSPSAGAREVLLIGCEQDAFRSPPLPDVPSELEELRATWREANGQVRGALINAREAPAACGCDLANWAKARIVHVACHGSFDAESPLNAALLLGQEKLRASEFFAARLEADLVVLSACDVGRRAQGWHEVDAAFDEWLGLYLPLFYAGAQALVVSRWKANSGKARQFMRALHGELARGVATSAAFRTACLKLAKSKDVFWANWSLAGIPPLD
ncbi:MAG TPA: CHAT domain-containing protein [Burkholderiales bacterium]|nr:CHAT domain-containing protein [Burkholderiales bacterium]